MINYTEITTASGIEIIQYQLENGDLVSFQKDLSNSDYQEYLAAQSTPSVE
jgi:hypothetical protein